MKLKRKYSVFFSVAITMTLLLTFSLSSGALSEYCTVKVTHTETTPYNWYFTPNKTGTQPLLDAELKFTENYKAFYYDKCVTDDDKVIYLTFDAGYENGNVEKVLDALDKHNAKGAFFVLDNLIIRNTELVKRMAEEGHSVCNHTCKHHDMTKCGSFEEFSSELKNLEDVFRENTGKELVKCYRPPEGRFNEQNLKWAQDLGYSTVFWSFAYADWNNDKQPDPEASIKKILDHTHNGMVILLHPTSATNAAILDTLLTEWEKAGYRFGTMEELMSHA